MCYMIEIHAYLHCLNYCLAYGYIFACNEICIHTSYFEWWVWKKGRWCDKVKERMWWYDLWIYNGTMYKVYVSMAYKCHRNNFKMYFMFSKRMSCHPPLREVIMRVQYRTIIIEIVVDELSRGNWGPCKPHLTTMLRARHVHENGVPWYMDIYF